MQRRKDTQIPPIATGANPTPRDPDFSLEKRRVTRIGVVILVLLPLCSGSRAQNSADPKKVWTSTYDGPEMAKFLATFSGTPNEWRAKPFNLADHPDTVDPFIRRDRDAEMDKELGADRPLLERNAAIPGVSADYDHRLLIPELPDLAGLSWVIGRFKSYRVNLSASGRSIYTEVTIEVQRSIGEPARDLKSFDIILGGGGGSVTLPDGQTVVEGLSPTDVSLQPGGTYLLLVGHHENEDFFLTRDVWDLSSGVVAPMYPAGKARAASKRSALAGLSLDSAWTALASHYAVGHEEVPK